MRYCFRSTGRKCVNNSQLPQVMLKQGTSLNAGHMDREVHSQRNTLLVKGQAAVVKDPESCMERPRTSLYARAVSAIHFEGCSCTPRTRKARPESEACPDSGVTESVLYESGYCD